MSKYTLIKLAIGAWALAQACAPAQAACTTTSNITVAVSPTAANTFSDIVADFQAAYSASYTSTCYTVSLVSDSDASIENTIVAAGGNSAYDIMISKSPVVPVELALKYSSYVAASPFAVAKDPLVLYSVTTDISGGLPSALSAFSVPDPATLDPYGLAAVQAMKGAWLYAVGKKLATKTPDAISSWTQVEYGGLTYGFTGKSQICTNVTGLSEDYETGSFHHEYVQGVDYFNGIAWTGVKLSRLSGGVAVRTAGQEAALNAFISFLSATSVPVTNPQNTGASLQLNAGLTDLAQHCLKNP
ncbi:substrate-binding domain-containing protein [Methylocapsa acidiphila]|uniref:substrate-binding domain-containing protein n=1 Tax=Methylocapsa acidiphila TaxID=133552 RepID=UPI0003FFEABE|nr:substrate-binding domain-containing protein [Methylocapsa acidiphila]